MKVSELISRLEKMPKDYEVKFHGHGCMHEDSIKNVHVDNSSYSKKNNIELVLLK